MKNKRFFPESELIINADGSCFHLHLRPEQMADRIILVGDPARVDTVAAHFDSRECEVSSREFHTITGTYKGKRITCQSHGIGCDNIDIVVNELDTLANIDYTTRQEREEHRMLTLVRIGTCGGIQLKIWGGDLIVASSAIRGEGTSYEYLPTGYPAAADFEVVKALADAADALSSDDNGNRYHVGVVHSKDSFYGQVEPDGSGVAEDVKKRWNSYVKCGCLASEMECSAIYSVGLVRGVRCGGVLTALWNAERSKLGMPDTLTDDSTRGIKCAVNAIKLLIERDKK